MRPIRQIGQISETRVALDLSRIFRDFFEKSRVPLTKNADRVLTISGPLGVF